MPNFIYGAISLTGGGSGALDSINGTGITNTDAAIVLTGNAAYMYSLDDDSAQDESSPDIIEPDNNAEDKRWILIASRASDIVVDTSNFANLLSSNENDTQKIFEIIDDMFSASDFTLNSGVASIKETFINIVNTDGDAAVITSHALNIEGSGRLSSAGSGNTVTFALANLNQAVKTTTYPMTASDDIIVGDTNGGDFTITLPAADAKDVVRIIKKDPANTLTIQRAGSDTIEGNTSVTLEAEDQMFIFTSDGISRWVRSGGGSIDRTESSSPTLTLTAAHDFVIATSSGDQTFTMPLATEKDIIRVGKQESTGVLTVERQGSDTIEGDTSFDVETQWDTVTLVSDSIDTWYTF